MVNCKYCNSTNTKKFGTFNGIQRYYCNDCKRKFVPNTALPYMQTPVEQVALALSLYYDGLSLNAICRNLKQAYGIYPSSSTVYGWITRFTKEAIAKTKDIKPELGWVWLADETMIEIDGVKHWLWDIIDVKTRFLIASHISLKRTVDDAIMIMHKANRRAGKYPKVIMTDSLNAYLDGISLSFGNQTRHLRTKKFAVKPNNNLIERMQGTIKGRTKVMRGLKSIDTAKLIMEGFLVHYNFIRPHQSLETKDDNYVTPAEKAKVELPCDDWLKMIKHTPKPKVSTARFTPIPFEPSPLTREQVVRKKERVRKRKARARQYRARAKASPSLRQIVVSPHLRTIRRIG
jgi:putative transposase